MKIENQATLSTTYTDPDTQEGVTEQKQSNTTSVQNMTESITKTETAGKETIKVNEEISIDTTITNGSTDTLTNLIFTDVLSDGLSFVEGSVEINGEAKPDDNPVTGITFETVNPEDTILINFKVKLNGNEHTGTVTSVGNLTYTAEETEMTDSTNTVSLNVVENLISVVKASDKTLAKKTDTIHYTITITNNGNYPNTALHFVDTIADTTTFVTGSVKVNDTEKADFDPTAGFDLTDLGVGEAIKVEFDVTVN